MVWPPGEAPGPAGNEDNKALGEAVTRPEEGITPLEEMVVAPGEAAPGLWKEGDAKGGVEGGEGDSGVGMV